jgi:hypothetical protein
MDRPIDICVAGVNEIGRGFWAYAARTLVQSSALIVMLLIIELALRNRAWATLRYWICMLVSVKLLLPPTVSLPTEIVALQESPREAVQAGVVTRAETAMPISFSRPAGFRSCRSKPSCCRLSRSFSRRFSPWRRRFPSGRRFYSRRCGNRCSRTRSP